MLELLEDVFEVAGIFKILSDPTRLKLYRILLTGVHCNCELSRIMNVSSNLISHHLRVLSSAGLVIAARSSGDARWIYYSINEDILNRVRQSIDPYLSMCITPVREPACKPPKKENQEMRGK